jgi:2-polyprenyl-3-methyl-5-hydroxy-6-metoxy-1,4-benzoquinol methylase
MKETVDTETVSCPLGCPPDYEFVLSGRDRLHGEPGEFPVIRCRRCGLLRTSPRPTPAAIQRYYPTAYGPYASTSVPGAMISAPPSVQGGFLARRLFTPRTNVVPPLSPGRLLEIGCGAGAFLHRMAQEGWEVEGLELSPEAGRKAQQLGFPVFIGSLSDAPDPAKSYDLIAGWMVLEHLHDPLQMLRKLWRWSAPGGWIALSVPDAGALEFRLFQDAWYALDVPRHLFHFTPKTAAQVLKQSGWELQRIVWQDNPNNLILSLRNRLQERGWQRTADFLKDVADGRRLGRLRLILGKLLGSLRASGRMTLWARRIEDSGR